MDWYANHASACGPITQSSTRALRKMPRPADWLYMVLMASVLGSLGVVLGTLAALRWWAARAVEDPSLDTDDFVTDRLDLLPEGHRPPPGLSPLSPSERFLSAEASGGLPDLQEWLGHAA